MKSRILLKEIPADTFHSAIFTTYSLNLYYFEQQVLPLLGNKGIHYISVLADSQMLSSQLSHYCLLSDQRKRNYALNGVKSDGAFHPKIIFLSGDDCALALIGSGNLTTSGHGKNLEVWNAIFVKSNNDPKLGLLIDIWNYVKELHVDLGESAQTKLQSIEENCHLLSSSKHVDQNKSYHINESEQISFLHPKKGSSIFKQVCQLIGNEQIEKITIMSPYFDIEGKFIEMVHANFSPKLVNVVLQEEFGVIPIKMKPSLSTNFYKWHDVQSEEFKQDYFHAKCIVFEGKQNTYLISGSANASIAAFGTEKSLSVNQEACVLLKSSQKDYLSLLGLKLTANKRQLSDFKDSTSAIPIQQNIAKNKVFIRSLEKGYDHMTAIIHSKEENFIAKLNCYDAKGRIKFSNELKIENGETKHIVQVDCNLAVMHGEISSNDVCISNKQFVTDIDAFENTNPSQKNRDLNSLRKTIESGDFSTRKIMDYLGTISKEKKAKLIVKPSGSSECNITEELSKEDENELLYMSYNEIHERIKNIDEVKNAKGYTDYKSVRLWDSIFSYLKEAKRKEEEARIDEEETEDINKATGREERKEKKKNAISRTNFERIQVRLIKFLDGYFSLLQSKINSKDASSPNLIDLSMFLIFMEVLFHLAGHKEKIKDEDCEEYLLCIPLNSKLYSWSDYLIQYIGMFTLWCKQQNGFKQISNDSYLFKLSSYKIMAYKTTVSALSLFAATNKRYDQAKIIAWRNVGLLNASLTFNTEQHIIKEISHFDEFVPSETREEVGEAQVSDEITASINFLNTFPINEVRVDTYYNHPLDGFSAINKVIGNDGDFLKLINIGYEWDDELLDFWNGKIHSQSKSKWYSSRDK